MKYSRNHTVYYNTSGIEVPSVTTILKILNKPFLAKWANIMGFRRQNIDDLLERSAQIGTLVHQAIEAYMMGKYYMWTGSRGGKQLIMAYLNSFLEWKRTHTVQPIFMERQFVTTDYGGTVDFYGIVDLKKTILDFKTSKKVYPTMFLQLAAYCIMLEEQGYEVEQLGIVIVNENGFNEKIVPRSFMDRYIEIFKILVALFHSWYDVNISDGWGSILDA